MGPTSKLPSCPILHALTVTNSLKRGIDKPRFPNLADQHALKHLPRNNPNERHKNDLLASKRIEEQFTSFIWYYRWGKIWRLLKIKVVEKNVFGIVVFPCSYLGKEKVWTTGMEHSVLVYCCWFCYLAKSTQNVLELIWDDSLWSFELYGCLS